jgi:hypothetical protein
MADRWEFKQESDNKWHWKRLRRNKRIKDPSVWGYYTIVDQSNIGFATREECEEYATRFGYRR